MAFPQPIGQVTAERQLRSRRLGMAEKELENRIGYQNAKMEMDRQRLGYQQKQFEFEQMKAQQEQAEAYRERIDKAVGSVLSGPETGWRASAEREVQRLKDEGVPGADKIPSWDNGLKDYIYKAASRSGQLPKGKTGKTYTTKQNPFGLGGVGQVESGTGKVVNYQKPGSGKESGLIEQYKLAKEEGYKGNFVQFRKDIKSGVNVSVNPTINMPGAVSKTDRSKQAVAALGDALSLGNMQSLMARYRKWGSGVTGLPGKAGELGGAVSATGIPGIEGVGKTITKRITGVTQKQLAGLKRDSQAFVAQTITELTAEESGRYTAQEQAIAQDANRVLKAFSGHEEVVGAMEAATAAKFTGFHKRQYIVTGKHKYDLIGGSAEERKTARLAFINELLKIDPQMDGEVAADSLRRMITFQELAARGEVELKK